MVVASRPHDTDYRHLLPLFEVITDPTRPATERTRVRDRIIRGHIPLAEHIAWKFRHRGQPTEDLEQVARLGLVLAVDRFDPARGNDFVAFAVPTITGEVQRYFRDHAWTLTVPRRLKDLYRAVAAASADLALELGSPPRPQQIAAALGIPVRDVFDGLQAGYAYRTETLDTLVRPHGDGEVPRHELVGDVDPALEFVDDQIALYPALAGLPRREATVVILRFFGELTQTQIAQRLGMSQMNVSRLLSRSLAELRYALRDQPEA